MSPRIVGLHCLLAVLSCSSVGGACARAGGVCREWVRANANMPLGPAFEARTVEGLDRARDACLADLGAPSSWLRENAALSLGLLPGAEVTRQLEETVADRREDEHVRIAATRSLAAGGSVESWPVLATALDDPSTPSDLRVWLIRGVFACARKDRDARRAIEAWLDSDDILVSATAEDVLRQPGWR